MEVAAEPPPSEAAVEVEVEGVGIGFRTFTKRFRGLGLWGCGFTVRDSETLFGALGLRSLGDVSFGLRDWLGIID